MTELSNQKADERRMIIIEKRQNKNIKVGQTLIIVLRRWRQDKTCTIYIHIYNNEQVTLAGLCFQLHDTRKITLPDSEFFFNEFYTKSLIIQREVGQPLTSTTLSDED